MVTNKKKKNRWYCITFQIPKVEINMLINLILFTKISHRLSHLPTLNGNSNKTKMTLKNVQISKMSPWVCESPSLLNFFGLLGILLK